MPPPNQARTPCIPSALESRSWSSTFRRKWAEDLQLLEWLVSRLPNYLNGAALRRISQGNQAATEAVLVALHNYLLAPKPRTPVPEPLTPEAAVVMEQTAARLVSLYLEGEDLFWLFLLKNVAASALLKRQKFGLTIVG